MRTQKTDKRTLRTQQLLQEKLVEKLQDRALQHITVRELTQAARINRGTFYLHYQGINDLYLALQSTVVGEITALVQPFLPLDVSAQGYSITRSVLLYIRDNWARCQALFRTDDTAFVRQLLIANRPVAQEIWAVFPTESEIGREYAYEYVVHGFSGIVRKWMDSGMQEHPDAVSHIAQELISRSLGHFKSNLPAER